MNAGPILIIDDEPANVALLERLLSKAGYANVAATTDPRRGLDLYRELDPDLLLLDLHMPSLTGFDVLREIEAERTADTYQPVLVLTADVTDAARERALRGGAMDFVTKPFDATEVLLRIRNLLMARTLSRRLAAKVEDREQAVVDAQIETARKLTSAAEFRDDETGQHIDRVGGLSERLALAIGFTPEDARMTGEAARLHDVGKIGVSDAVLLKTGAFTQAEFEQMRAHTILGAGILANASSPLLQLAADVALTHHERFDGEGYPHGLHGAEIPLAGRIVAIADTFDAITNHRRYRAARSEEEALHELRKERGRQFDPELVEVFVRLSFD